MNSTRGAVRLFGVDDVERERHAGLMAVDDVGRDLEIGLGTYGRTLSTDDAGREQHGDQSRVVS